MTELLNWKTGTTRYTKPFCQMKEIAHTYNLIWCSLSGADPGI